MSDIILMGNKLRRETFPGYNSGRDTLGGLDNGFSQYKMTYDERVKMENELVEIIESCLYLDDED